MAELLIRDRAIFAEYELESEAGLSISEIDDRAIWSLGAANRPRLTQLTQDLFGREGKFGKMLQQDEFRLIYLQPGQILLLGTYPAQSKLPDYCSTWITDVSHGYSELALQGKNAFAFLADYLSIDLNHPQHISAGNLRCRLGHYRILLWWDQTDDLRILVERSYAQSLQSRLAQLIQKRDWRDTP